MKTYAIIITALFLISLWLHYDQTVDSNIKIRNAEEKARFHEAKADSAKLRELLLVDSLEKSYLITRNIQEEKERERELRIKAEKRHEKVIYVRFDNDSLRARALSELYGSYGHP